MEPFALKPRGKTLIPDDFQLTPEMRAWARKNAPTVHIEEQFEMFCDYWRAHGKKMLDWHATWRNWMRRAPQFAAPVNQYSQLRGRQHVQPPHPQASPHRPHIAPPANLFDNSPRFPRKPS